MTRTARTALADLADIFADSTFTFDFRFQYAHGEKGVVTKITTRTFQALVAAGSVKAVGLAAYQIA